MINALKLLCSSKDNSSLIEELSENDTGNISWLFYLFLFIYEILSYNSNKSE